MLGQDTYFCDTVGCFAPVTHNGQRCSYCQSLERPPMNKFACASCGTPRSSPVPAGVCVDCMRTVLVEGSKQPIHANPMAVLKPALQTMIPGERFTMDFYGRIHRFAFEAWEGHNVVARPSAQPWALVRIPLTDLVTFNATVTNQDF